MANSGREGTLSTTQIVNALRALWPDGIKPEAYELIALKIAASEGSSSAHALNSLPSRIMRFVASNPGSGFDDIARHITDYCARSIRMEILQLRSKGAVRITPKGTSYQYWVT